ncbi:MAG TPA: DUF6515 family protein [Polyangia bacterium]
MRPNVSNNAARASFNANRYANFHRHDVNMRRNTFVRTAPRPYVRAPFVYGGHRYYAYHPYRYHRYVPFGFSAGFFPFGAFVGALAASAILVPWADYDYYYNAGVWYLPAEGGYTVVTAPVGARVTSLPPGATLIDPATGTYYYGGTYYQRTSGGYVVVAPQAGTVVESLPEGGEEVTIGGQTYVRIGDTYYQPIQIDGRNMYEVVEVR